MINLQTRWLIYSIIPFIIGCLLGHFTDDGKWVVIGIVMGLVLGIIDTLISSNDSDKSNYNYIRNTNDTVSINKKWALNEFKEFWIINVNYSLKEALDNFYKQMIINRAIPVEISKFSEGDKKSQRAYLKKHIAKSKLIILKTNEMDNHFEGDELIKYMFYKEHLEVLSKGETILDRTTRIRKGGYQDSISSVTHRLISSKKEMVESVHIEEDNTQQLESCYYNTSVERDKIKIELENSKLKLLEKQKEKKSKLKKISNKLIENKKSAYQFNLNREPNVKILLDAIKYNIPNSILREKFIVEFISYTIYKKVNANFIKNYPKYYDMLIEGKFNSSVITEIFLKSDKNHHVIDQLTIQAKSYVL